MHGAPKIMIIAKRQVAGDEMPDFGGPCFGEARKEMVEDDYETDEKSEMMDPVGDEDADLEERLEDAVKALDKASKLHAQQAELLREVLGRKNRGRSDSYDRSGGDDKSGGGGEPSYGKAKELT